MGLFRAIFIADLRLQPDLVEHQHLIEQQREWENTDSRSQPVQVYYWAHSLQTPPLISQLHTEMSILMSETFCFVFTFQPLMAVSTSPTCTRSAVVFGTSTISFLVRTRERTHIRTHTEIHSVLLPDVLGHRITSVSAATLCVLLCYCALCREVKTFLSSQGWSR